MNRDHVIAIVVLIGAIGLSAGIVYGGPIVASRLIGPATSAAMADTIFNLVLFGGLLLLAVIGGLLCRVNAVAPGQHAAILFPAGLAIGTLGLSMAAGDAWLAGTLARGETTFPGIGLIAWGTAVVFLQASAEEAYFRGWLQPVLARAWGRPVAVLVAALAFAALHVMGGTRAPITLVNLLLGGLLFGTLAAYGRGIAGAVGAHFAWNASEQLLFGLDPNPGIGSFGSLMDFELIGPAAWGGSDEGLNASFAMSMVLIALLIPVILLTRDALIGDAARPAPASAPTA